ncbi:MAG: (d)CMP kinase [Spirochaetales bacterium]|nr:(d)CMP kinase [Spirochaetales bacterium]
MVVAIDGPAGVGKSSIAAAVAERFGFFNLNSGSFYRALALKVLAAQANPADVGQVMNAVEGAQLDIVDGRLHLDGVDVEGQLRSDAVDRASSMVSSHVPLRHRVNEHLRRIAGTMDLVSEGRDMGTVVFPHAEVKIFLDASPAVRAQRRFEQGTSDLDLAALEASIRERDERDRNKEEGSLIAAPDAQVIDTSSLTLEEVCARVTGLITTYQ